MKKIIFCVMALMFAMAFVSAQYGNDLGANLGHGMEQLINAVEGMFGPFFSVFLGGSGDYLFERILFLFIIIAFVFIVLSRTPIFQNYDNKVVLWIITLSIAILSTRFLTETEMIKTMLLPYSVLGVAITAGLPLIIYFYFVQSFDDSATLRKMLWIFFMVVFIGLWSSRYGELGAKSWIYMMTAIAALIFFLFDGTIRNAIVRQQLEEVGGLNKSRYLAKLRRELDDLRKERAYYSDADYVKIEKRLIRDIKRVTKARVK